LTSFAATGMLEAVSLSQIRYFVAVAEEGNVGRAAQRLHIAQPPVSRQILALEDEIGAQLFERTPRGMTLLPPGRVFLDHARAILAAVDRAVVATRAETEPSSAASLPPSTRKPDS
jgi:DNA-binding transcriptional LysR family regulator